MNNIQHPRTDRVEADENGIRKEGATTDGVEDVPLEPVHSRHPSVRDVSSIPNGGLTAWLQVLGSFFLLFNSW